MNGKTIYCYDLKEVKKITLLSIVEWKEARKIPTVPKHTSRWWLRSPGYFSDYAASINSDGSIRDYGYGVYSIDNCVRPAFIISDLKFEVGSKVFVETVPCTVISESIALSDIAVCQHRFDENINEYEKSEIKRYINSDEFKGLL